jgi:hypothetical protein
MSLWNRAAWGQQTAASQHLAAKASGRRGGLRGARKRRKARAKVASAPRRRRKTATRRVKARLVKGSAAAKRYMAKIRRKRK